MPELRELYSDVILEHEKRPHNLCIPKTANRKADGYNPLCGDRLTLYLEVQDNIVRDAGFQGSGCAISQASASLLTESVKGKTVRETEELLDRVHRMLNSNNCAPAEPDGLGKLSVLAGVRGFPARVECANLAWRTLLAALKSC
jgi:nitrogen fixation NifU-like protein